MVLAWRGTEQLKWKDLLTDVRLSPTGFNVERVRGAGAGGRSVPVRTKLFRLGLDTRLQVDPSPILSGSSSACVRRPPQYPQMIRYVSSA